MNELPFPIDPDEDLCTCPSCTGAVPMPAQPLQSEVPANEN